MIFTQDLWWLLLKRAGNIYFIEEYQVFPRSSKAPATCHGYVLGYASFKA